MSDAYYAYVDQGLKPSVMVIQDLDGDQGYGSFWGEVNSNIHKGFGCEGLVTDGCSGSTGHSTWISDVGIDNADKHGSCSSCDVTDLVAVDIKH